MTERGPSYLNSDVVVFASVGPDGDQMNDWRKDDRKGGRAHCSDQVNEDSNVGNERCQTN